MNRCTLLQVSQTAEQPEPGPAAARRTGRRGRPVPQECAHPHPATALRERGGQGIHLETIFDASLILGYSMVSVPMGSNTGESCLSVRTDALCSVRIASFRIGSVVFRQPRSLWAYPPALPDGGNKSNPNEPMKTPISGQKCGFTDSFFVKRTQSETGRFTG